MNFDVIGFGALNLDKLYKVNMIATAEEEAFITDFHASPGGSAANTIVGLARLQIRTGFIGKMGDDPEGQLLLQAFVKENVDTRGIIVAKGQRSGVVTGYIDSKGERALYVDPGVNDTLKFPEVNLDYVTEAEFLHLSSFVGNNPFIAQTELVAHNSDIKISFDPGALYARKNLSFLKLIIQRCHVMLPNANEIRLITGKSYDDGAQQLLDEGAGLIAVKLGAEGCFVTNGKERYRIPAYEKQLVDTTGAGDAFNAGFLFGVIQGKDLYECGQLGNFVAARCVSHMGARVGLPRLADLKNL